jgi:hypothetical protein
VSRDMRPPTSGLLLNLASFWRSGFAYRGFV